MRKHPRPGRANAAGFILSLTVAFTVQLLVALRASSLAYVNASSLPVNPVLRRLHRVQMRRAHKRDINQQNHPQDRIAAFVATVQPRKGARYAVRVARAIRRSANATGLSPDVILATGYVESEFRMGAGPCRGIMQIHPPTLREMRRRQPSLNGLDPDRVEDNIRLGALELASYTKGQGQARAWARYNGSTVGGSYVRRAQTVLRCIRTGNVALWRRHLKERGPLWNG